MPVVRQCVLTVDPNVLREGPLRGGALSRRKFFKSTRVFSARWELYQAVVRPWKCRALLT